MFAGLEVCWPVEQMYAICAVPISRVSERVGAKPRRVSPWGGGLAYIHAHT